MSLQRLGSGYGGVTKITIPTKYNITKVAFRRTRDTSGTRRKVHRDHLVVRHSVVEVGGVCVCTHSGLTVCAQEIGRAHV